MCHDALGYDGSFDHICCGYQIHLLLARVLVCDMRARCAPVTEAPPNEGVFPIWLAVLPPRRALFTQCLTSQMSKAEPQFDGLRVGAFESRRADELARLITRSGGVAHVSPSMREVPAGRKPVGDRLRASAVDGRNPRGGFSDRRRIPLAGGARSAKRRTAEVLGCLGRYGDDRTRPETRRGDAGNGRYAHPSRCRASYVARGADDDRRTSGRG